MVRYITQGRMKQGFVTEGNSIEQRSGIEADVDWGFSRLASSEPLLASIRINEGEPTFL